MKYKIVIYKEKEKVDSNDPYMGMMHSSMIDGRAQQIFEAKMSSDNCIEILQHLYDLKDRKLID